MHIWYHRELNSYELLLTVACVRACALAIRIQEFKIKLQSAGGHPSHQW